MKCIECGKKIDILADVCPFCGEEQFDDIPAKEIQMRPIIKREKKKILRDFSDEEILAMGLYPQNETYKMSLISRILGNR